MTAVNDIHLLIVDDDERIRGLLQKFLIRAGFFVSAARDAAHARRLLAGLDFDLIVLDVMMPGEDGIALTRSLRQTLTVPILVLTAKGDTGDRIWGLRRGRMTILQNRSSQRNCCCGSTPFCAGCPWNRAPLMCPKSCTLGRCAMMFSGARCGMAALWCA